MLKQTEEYQFWKKYPRKKDHHDSYVRSGNIVNWERINQIVSPSGFGVTEIKSTEEEKPSKFEMTWPSKEQKEKDFEIFSKVISQVVLALNMDDAEYNTKLPMLFNTLKESSLFNLLFNKQSASQGNSIEHHVREVASLTQTDELTPQEKLTLRITSIFHDTGKAFDIGSDQLQYHSLISADIINQVLRRFENLIRRNVSYMNTVSGETSEYVELNDKIGIDGIGYEQFVNQITEITRLHHILEKIDKGQIDLETVAHIFLSSEVNTLIFGQFVLADGGSVVPDNARYGEYLIQNISILTQLVEQINSIKETNNIAYDKTSDEINRTVAQALIVLISNLIETVTGLISTVEKFVGETTKEITEIISIALLGINSLTNLEADLSNAA